MAESFGFLFIFFSGFLDFPPFFLFCFFLLCLLLSPRFLGRLLFCVIFWCSFVTDVVFLAVLGTFWSILGLGEVVVWLGLE